ncbi:MAG: hypothetical protein ACYDAL_16255 [Candidatus Dormibacteraceae bacterium]
MSLRLQGPNFFQDLSITTLNQEYIPVGDLTRPKWLWGLLCELKGRVAVSVAATGAVLAEAPQSLVNWIRVEGIHKVLGQRTIFYMRGPTSIQFANAYGRGRALTLTNGGIVPNAANTAIGNYDFDIAFLVPFAPQGIPLNQQALFMLKTEDWKTLQVRVSIGDSTAIWNSTAGSTITFSAFGSATGSPIFSINTIEPQLGSFRNSINPALVQRVWQDITTPFTASTLTDGLLAQLSVGLRYRGFLFKQGTLATARSGGVTVFAQNGLVDTILTRPLVKLDQSLIRNPKNTFAAKEWTGFALAFSQPTGYGLMEFAEGGDIRTLFPAHRLTTANKFEFRGDVAAAANQQGELVEERIEGNPTYQDRQGNVRSLFVE